MTAATYARTKFEIGRHESFALRETWLPKGLSHLAETGGFVADSKTADTLGLGSAMAKSLQFWLEASGLAERSGKAPITLSALGREIHRLDPYFEFPMTWWLVHIHLARRTGSVWNWFFNDFRERTFDRTGCVDAFGRHLRDHASNTVSEKSAQRDVACLLQSYVAPPPSERLDPEDASACPLRGLSLLHRQASTGRIERSSPFEPVPVESFLACCTLMADGDGEVSLSNLIQRRNAPGRILGMDADAIDNATERAVARHGSLGVALTLHGADRVLTIPAMSPADWLTTYFQKD